MRKKIFTQIKRMIIAVCLVIALVAWTRDFVWTGVTSNIYLNSTIIGMFLFGIYLAFKSVLNLMLGYIFKFQQKS